MNNEFDFVNMGDFDTLYGTTIFNDHYVTLFNRVYSPLWDLVFFMKVPIFSTIEEPDDE
jgi:hypothetical protein